MKRFHIGTTIPVQLNFWKKGNSTAGGPGEYTPAVNDIPCDVSGYRKKVYYNTPKGVIYIDDYIEGEGTLSWTFEARKQKVTGVYTIVVELYQGDETLLLKQEFMGFGLFMPHVLPYPDTDKTIIRDAWLELYEFHPVIPEMSVRTENWVVDGVDTGKTARGKGWVTGRAVTTSKLSLSATFNAMINTYGQVLKVGDIYYNSSTNDVFLCEDSTISGATVTTRWSYLTNLKGEPFRYSDFTPAQIAQLQKPATDAAAGANTAAGAANAAATAANTAKGKADAAASAANTAATAANTAAGKINAALTEVKGVMDTAIVAEDITDPVKEYDADRCVSYAGTQSLTPEQKRIARENIGAAAADGNAAGGVWDETAIMILETVLSNLQYKNDMTSVIATLIDTLRTNLNK